MSGPLLRSAPVRVAHDDAGGGVPQVVASYGGPLGRPRDASLRVDQGHDLVHGPSLAAAAA